MGRQMPLGKGVESTIKPVICGGRPLHGGAPLRALLEPCGFRSFARGTLCRHQAHRKMAIIDLDSMSL